MYVLCFSSTKPCAVAHVQGTQCIAPYTFKCAAFESTSNVSFRPNIVPLLGRFSELPHLLSDLGVPRNSLDAVLFDTGASSSQYDQAARGFALKHDGPLDMRMDKNR